MHPTRLLALVLCLSLPLASSASAAARIAECAPAMWGPPVMCHAIAFASGESLSFGEGRFDTDESVDRTKVVNLTLTLIDGSDDTFFHMETLRRGLVYVAWGENPLKSQVEQLVKALEGRRDAAQRVLDHATVEAVPGARHVLGLAAFDLAWTLEGLQEVRLNPRSTKARDAALELALAHRADDDALQLGAAILSLARHDDEALYKHLGKALEGVKQESSLLARNADNTIGAMMNVRGLRALAALSEKKNKRA